MLELVLYIFNQEKYQDTVMIRLGKFERYVCLTFSPCRWDNFA